CVPAPIRVEVCLEIRGEAAGRAYRGAPAARRRRGGTEVPGGSLRAPAHRTEGPAERDLAGPPAAPSADRRGAGRLDQLVPAGPDPGAPDPKGLGPAGRPPDPGGGGRPAWPAAPRGAR